MSSAVYTDLGMEEDEGLGLGDREEEGLAREEEEEEEGEGREVFPPGGRRPDDLEVVLVEAEIEKFRKQGLENFYT